MMTKLAWLLVIGVVLYTTVVLRSTWTSAHQPPKDVPVDWRW